jgi:hypothetical protein
LGAKIAAKGPNLQNTLLISLIAGIGGRPVRKLMCMRGFTARRANRDVIPEKPLAPHLPLAGFSALCDVNSR